MLWELRTNCVLSVVEGTLVMVTVWKFIPLGQCKNCCLHHHFWPHVLCRWCLLRDSYCLVGNSLLYMAVASFLGVGGGRVGMEYFYVVVSNECFHAAHELLLTLTVFLLNIWCNLCCLQKYLSIPFRKILPMFICTFILYGRLYHIMLHCLLLLLQLGSLLQVRLLVYPLDPWTIL